MRLDVVLPTLNRKNKLTACVESISKARKQYDVNLHIYFSRKEDFIDYTEEWIQSKYTDYRKCTIFWNEHLKQMKADAMAYFNDDILVNENTFDELYQTFLNKFVDYDGVMGINQSNIPKEKGLQSAFGVIGSKYADRFPDRQVWCPDYYRFYGDAELMKFAKSINKFYYAENVQITHLHPSHVQHTADSTHSMVRKWRTKDGEIKHKREILNKLLWGREWRLVDENDFTSGSD